jgi:hypothetical protein
MSLREIIKQTSPQNIAEGQVQNGEQRAITLEMKCGICTLSIGADDYYVMDTYKQKFDA